MKHILSHDGRRHHFLYFVEAIDVGRMKIGITAEFARRFRSLQNSSPLALTVRAVVRGTARHEAALHALFAESRLHGEWFDITDTMRSFVRGLNISSKSEITGRLDSLLPLISPPKPLPVSPRVQQRQRAVRLWTAVEVLLQRKGVAA